tara:strand:- start:7040 stop:7936 length:897 start_codon:yes stop_codon:yes gene_type:complete
MALKNSGMIETTSGTTAAVLKAESGESLFVRDIQYHDVGANAESLNVTIDRKDVFQFEAPTGWYLLQDDYAAEIESISQLMREAGLFPTFPVAEGEELQVSGGTAGSVMNIVYDMYDAGDVKNTWRNGTRSKKSEIWQVVDNSTAIAAAGDADLDASDLDSVYPAFPGGALVPAGEQWMLKALFGSPASTGDTSANDLYTTRLKLIRDRTDIFDKDRVGAHLLGNSAYTAAAPGYESHGSLITVPKANQRGKIYQFPTPPIFNEGQELLCKITCALTSAGDFGIGELKLGLVFDIERK